MGQVANLPVGRVFNSPRTSWKLVLRPARQVGSLPHGRIDSVLLTLRVRAAITRSVMQYNGEYLDRLANSLMPHETMTSRQRVLAALNHETPDRVPIDLGGNQTGIHKFAYEALLDASGHRRRR